ncbi:CPBP family intramembrane metalloprotease [Paenibacillus sp. HWE-109]|uniref:CPBP family intramembrane glutamic endopeptidase n=1 Tax=Paenibacillus sp. HWE-109 TaxID=1306526 RepID=UPI001EE095CC|nr:type II CAAX endopeptidase family protein [Paenibacillus sp. HWE-109]UKS25299.1 CPBP family intramembrane metalloprotease [Paenibacillus sp. HWE-109]
MILLLLIAPTVLIYAGLYVFQNVPITFLLFYGWLFLMPVLFKTNVLRNLTDKTRIRHILVGIGLGTFCLVGIIVSGALLHNELFDSSQLGLLLKKWEFTGEYTIGLVFILTLVNPLLEEIYWRGFILEKLHSMKYKVLISSFFYSLYHFLVLLPMFKGPYPLIFFLLVFFAGIVWGWMVIKFRTLWGSIICHALADTGIIVIYFSYLPTFISNF